jgi:hypothetical protein
VFFSRGKQPLFRTMSRLVLLLPWLLGRRKEVKVDWEKNRNSQICKTSYFIMHSKFLPTIFDY